MVTGGFKQAHLEFLKDLNIQELNLGKGGSSYYLVPQENFNELERRLNLLSCGSTRINLDHPFFSYLNSAEKFCKLCSPSEKLQVLSAGDGTDHSESFYGFPREIHSFETIVGLELNKTQEILDQYLNRLHSELRTKCIEGLGGLELYWANKSDLSMERNNIILGEIDNLFRFLRGIERLLKKVKGPEPWYSNNYVFRLCSTHNNEENLSDIKEEFIIKTVEEFGKYGIKLSKSDLTVDFEGTKIFTI